ncbi:MAG: eccA1 [Herbinix sp.]|jgi:SpoVK/Ycf46/Vps4 family AAA+-type ATPase|nr:eccA1 [Herbinix sp.]
MEQSEIIRLRSLGKHSEIAAIADNLEPWVEENVDKAISIAEVYNELKLYEKSIRWYLRALELGTEEDIITPISELYRITWIDSKEWDKLYCKALEVEIPDHQKSMILYEKLLSEKVPKKQLIDILTTYAEEELYDLHLMELAELHIEQGELDDAKKLIRKVLRFSVQEQYLEYANALLEQIKAGNVVEFNKADTIRTIMYSHGIHTFEGEETTVNDRGIEPTISSVEESTISPKLEKRPEPEKRNPALLELFQHNTKHPKNKKQIVISIELLFDRVVGMQPVKEGLQSFYDVLQYQNQIRSLGVGEDILNKNFLITGEKGSGKTLVAEILATMLEMFGMIDNSAILEVNARDVQEAFSKDGNNGLLELFSELRDMVVVIDHIDRLFEESKQQDNNSVLPEAIVELMKARKDSLSFVITGPKSVMDTFVNEDMRNQIYCRLDITGYTIDELVELTCKLAEEKGFMIKQNAYKALRKRIQVERCTGEFANAITLEAVLQDAIKRKAERHKDMVYKDKMDTLLQFDGEDFEPEDCVGESIEELLNKLDGLTGLDSVKKEVRSRIEGVVVQQNAVELGAKRRDGFGTLHMLFKGGPGTGKTTVARIIGKIYQKLGVLPKGNVFVECSRKDLVGEYQGHTAKKTHDKVMEALGGVLFIDEAYSLVQGQGDSFGLEVLSTLVADIENYRDSIMVILAGYSEEIDELISHNPGLASRFPNEIQFEDYTSNEMADIFNYIVQEKGMLLDRNTSDTVLRLIKEKSAKKDFGNARGVRNLVEKVKSSMERRLMEMKSVGEHLSRNDYDIIRVQDIEAVINQKSVKEKTVEDLMKELENMTGLASVKRKVREMVALIKRKQISEELSYKVNSNFGSLHLVFLGSAGTGKTTVARLIGQIYEKLGVLKNGDIFVECSRAGLIGQYQGHTTKKVEDKVKEAEGGILFIDEAYDLCHGNNDDFGREIVSTLLKEIEDKRDNLMVIMAGYKDKIEEFFGTNQGLKSRMATQITFEDYTVEELTRIFYYMAASNQLIVEAGLEEFIKQRISEELQKQTDFGNARGVRNLYEEVIRKQALRLFDLESGSITKEKLNLIIREDFIQEGN